MTEFAQHAITIISLGAILLQIDLVVLLVLYIKDKNGRWIAWAQKYALHIAFGVALAGTLGSLFMSEVIGFPPCKLCWIQRAFLFPQVAILAVALWMKDKSAIPYLFALNFVGWITALYQVISQATGISIAECTAEGGECAKVYFTEFGYITIPVLSLTIFTYLLVIYWIKGVRYVSA